MFASKCVCMCMDIVTITACVLAVSARHYVVSNERKGSTPYELLGKHFLFAQFVAEWNTV